MSWRYSRETNLLIDKKVKRWLQSHPTLNIQISLSQREANLSSCGSSSIPQPLFLIYAPTGIYIGSNDALDVNDAGSLVNLRSK